MQKDNHINITNREEKSYENSSSIISNQLASNEKANEQRLDTQNLEGKSLRKGIKKKGFTLNDTIQILLLIVNIGMLYAFIKTSSDQYENTKKALAKTEEANILTQKSIQQTERIAIASDSSTKQALYIAENSLNLSRKNFDIIRQNTKFELKGYLFIDTVYFYMFRTGERPVICIKARNVGKTPLNNLRLEGKLYFRDRVFNATGLHPFPIQGNNTKYSFYNTIDFFLSKVDSTEIVNGVSQMYSSYKFTFNNVFDENDSLLYKSIYIPKYKMWVLMQKEPEFYLMFQ